MIWMIQLFENAARASASEGTVRTFSATNSARPG
jgi:hypothetical protein